MTVFRERAKRIVDQFAAMQNNAPLTYAYHSVLTEMIENALKLERVEAFEFCAGLIETMKEKSDGVHLYYEGLPKILRALKLNYKEIIQ